MTYHTDRLDRAVCGAVTVAGKGRLLSFLLSSCGPCFLSISPLAPSPLRHAALGAVLSCPRSAKADGAPATHRPQPIACAQSKTRGKGSWRLVVAAGDQAQGRGSLSSLCKAAGCEASSVPPGLDPRVSSVWERLRNLGLSKLVPCVKALRAQEQTGSCTLHVSYHLCS